MDSRQVNSGEVPDGFVVENGRLVPFWYSRVSNASHPSRLATCPCHTVSVAASYVLTHSSDLQTGVIIKWSVFLGMMVILTLYVTIGYMHAKRRIRKNLPPLGYHRVRCCLLTSTHHCGRSVFPSTVSPKLTTHPIVAHKPRRARPRRPALRLPAALGLHHLPARVLQHAAQHGAPAAHVRPSGTAPHVRRPAGWDQDRAKPVDPGPDAAARRGVRRAERTAAGSSASRA